MPINEIDKDKLCYLIEFIIMRNKLIHGFSSKEVKKIEKIINDIDLYTPMKKAKIYNQE